ncbi:SRPBCC domain-containing protein [Candidatus Bipolaricaulota bacterium]
MSNARTVLVKQYVDATPADVYRAFTSRLALRMWFCADAQVDPRVEGRIFLRWPDDYYAAGEFTRLEPGESLEWRWHGRGELFPTEVSIAISASGEGADITVEHRGLGAGMDWDEQATEVERRWAEGLENLASVWGMTGLDLRQTRRPMLGIYLGGFVEGTEHGLPAGTRGMAISGTVENSGAKACGLLRGDIMTDLNGVSLTEQGSFGLARNEKRAGDAVPMTFFRDGEKIDSTLTFSTPPSPPDVPNQPTELARIIEEQYKAFAMELNDILGDVTDAEASFHPSEGAWNVKEILAHLVLFERCFQQWLSMSVEGEELGAFAAGVPARVRAILARFSSVVALRTELLACRTETVALLRGLTEPFVGRPEYVRMGQIIIGEAVHTTFHHEQLRRTAESAKLQNVT